MTTVFDVVRSSADVLRKAGVDTPEHDAKLLLAEAFRTDLQHVDKAMLMGDGVERLAEKEDAEPAMERFQTMLARRVKREPLQHITGHAPFRYLDLKVGPGVFIPRPETELVVQEGVDWATRNGMYRAKVVDLCAGSGAIGLAFASEVPGSEVWAVEKSATTAEWTRRLPTFPNSRKCAIMIPIWRYTAVRRMARSFRNASSHARRNCFVRVDLW